MKSWELILALIKQRVVWYNKVSEQRKCRSSESWGKACNSSSTISIMTDGKLLIKCYLTIIFYFSSIEKRQCISTPSLSYSTCQLKDYLKGCHHTTINCPYFVTAQYPEAGVSCSPRLYQFLLDSKFSWLPWCSVYKETVWRGKFR